MKITGCLTVGLIVCCFSASIAQEIPTSGNQIVVYGIGAVDRPADQAQITYTVKGFGPSLEAAVDTARNKIAEISRRLLAAGLKEENLFTSQFNSGDNFEGKAFLSSSRDFRAQIDSRVTVDSLQILERVVGILATSPIGQLSNITFSLKNDPAAKLEARRLAVANAQGKAELMTKQLGVSLGKVLYVEELLSYADADFYLPPREQPAFDRSMAQITVAPGAHGAFYGQQFSTKCGVKVVFALTTSK